MVFTQHDLALWKFTKRGKKLKYVANKRKVYFKGSYNRNINWMRKKFLPTV